jgi:DNA-binding transcriptional regulator YiaG
MAAVNAKRLRIKRTGRVSTTLNPTPVGRLRESLGMPRRTFARLMGRTERALIDLESGKAKPQGLSEQRVRELQRLQAALAKLFRPEAVGPWFEKPNDAFGGLKPVEVIERGESDRIWQMIFEISSGSHV